MASCDVQATPSDDNIEEDTAEAETQTESVNKFEARTTKNGTVPQPTKIPGPVRLDNTGSYIHTSTRKYTSLMKSLQTKGEHDDSFSSTSTLVNTAEDSGIQMDCSTVETDEMNAYSDIPCQPSSSTPRLQRSTDTVAISGSLQELEEAEQQTLRVLQRAVAEMEADVALHAELLEEQMKLELENQQKLQFEEDVQQEFKKTLLPETVEEQKQQQQQQQQPDHKQLKLQPEQQTPSIHARAGVRERKHVRVEQLLEAEHDIELLHKLLQVDEGEQLAHGELNNALAQPSEKLCLPDLNAGKDMEDLDRCATDSAAAEFNRKHISLLHSLLHIICGKGIRKLSYPILFCGMAVGLIYYFRKD